MIIKTQSQRAAELAERNRRLEFAERGLSMAGTDAEKQRYEQSIQSIKADIKALEAVKVPKVKAEKP